MKRSNPKYLVTYRGTTISRGSGMGDSGGWPIECLAGAETIEGLGKILNMANNKEPILFRVTNIDQNEMQKALEIYEEEMKAEKKTHLQKKIAELQAELER